MGCQTIEYRGRTYTIACDPNTTTREELLERAKSLYERDPEVKTK